MLGFCKWSDEGILYARSADASIGVVKTGAPISGPLDVQGLVGYRPVSVRFGGRIRARAAVAPENEGPTVGAGPFFGPVILTAAQGEAGVGRMHVREGSG